ERLQRSEPRGDHVRLQLSTVGVHPRAADPADPRREGATVSQRARRIGPRSVLVSAALSLACALGASACADFPDVSTVVDLRVLAVKTDPPDVFLKVTGLPADPTTPPDPRALGIDPASIPTIHVTPLIVDPGVDIATVTFSLSVCPNNPYGAAPPNSVMGG